MAWTLSRTAAANSQSVASHKRLGAGFISRATFLVVGPLQLMLANLPLYSPT